MRRREFIAFVGSGVAASALAARAQQPERIRKIGMLMNFSAEDPEGQARVKAYDARQEQQSRLPRGGATIPGHGRGAVC